MTHYYKSHVLKLYHGINLIYTWSDHQDKPHILPWINHIFVIGNIRINHIFRFLYRRDKLHILQLSTVANCTSFSRVARISHILPDHQVMSDTLPWISHILVIRNIGISHIFLYRDRGDRPLIHQLNQLNTLHALDCNSQFYATSPCIHFDIPDAILRMLSIIFFIPNIDATLTLNTLIITFSRCYHTK